MKTAGKNAGRILVTLAMLACAGKFLAH